MKFDEYGNSYLTSDDVCKLLYKNPNTSLDNVIVEDPEVFNAAVKHFYLDIAPLKSYLKVENLSIEEFDSRNISNWYMPEEYKKLDIVEYVANLCKTEIELERVAQEFLLYEERNLFDLLRFLKYMVDIFKEHDIVYGVGRGSSTASYVLYLLNVHKINSIAYDLDIHEFLK
jgi:DNA polymerase III alpha subunit